MTPAPTNSLAPTGSLELRRRGFTLIEMLVVISIITLLISMLSPALVKSRKAARDVACLSNLHQHGIAVQAYLDEQKDTFAITQSWADLSGKRGNPARNPSNLYGANDIPYEDRPLNAYLGDPLVSRCPSDRGDSYDSPAFIPITNAFESYGNSYQAPFSYDVLRTAYAFGDRDALGNVTSKPRKIYDFAASPTNKVIQGDYVWWGNRRLEFPKSWWHCDGDEREYNMLFADWHAELFHFPMDQEAYWPAPDPPPSPANLWW